MLLADGSSLKFVMRGILLLAILITPVVVQGQTSWEKFSDAMDQAQATNRIIDKLTANDIPSKWRTTTELNITNGYTKNVFFRGKKKVLEVGWSENWTGARSNFFVAKIYDGQTLVTTVIGLRQGTFVNSPDKSKKYEVTTGIKTNGEITVQAMYGTNYVEFFKICGRDTHPMGDLEYTKTMLKLEQMGHVTDILANEIGEDKNEREKSKSSEK